MIKFTLSHEDRFACCSEPVSRHSNHNDMCEVGSLQSLAPVLPPMAWTGTFVVHGVVFSSHNHPTLVHQIEARPLGRRKKEFGYALRIGADGTIERPPGEGVNTSHGARTDRVIHRLGDHPIHVGLPRRWKTPLIEVYTHARGPAENVTVLSWAEDPGTRVRWPIEWKIQYGKGRIYNSTFGHVWRDEVDPVDLRCAGFQTLLVRSLQWLAKRPVDFPTEENTVLRPLR